MVIKNFEQHDAEPPTEEKKAPHEQDASTEKEPEARLKHKAVPHLPSGIVGGVGNMVAGVLGGAAAVVAAPVIGAKKAGVKGFVAGTLLAPIVGAGAVIAGVGAGAAQIVEGVASTPGALMHMAAKGEEWDELLQKWVPKDDFSYEKAVWIDEDDEKFLSEEVSGAI